MRIGRVARWFVLPTLLLLLILIIYPTIYLWVMMFFKFNPLTDMAPKFAGLRNFKILLMDPEARYSILAMLALMGLTIPVELFLGIFLGVLFTERGVKGKLPLRTLFLIPLMIPPVIIGLNWKMIFFTEGPLNAFLKSLGLKPQPWLSAPFGNPYLVLVTLAILDIWQWTPFITLAVVSGIESLPREVYEAAWLDGAKETQILRHIVLPLIKSVVVAVLLLRVVDSLKIFDTIYTLTYGGPGSITTTLPFYIFKTGYTLTATFSGYGYTSLLSIILLAIAACLATGVMKVIKIERLVWE